MVTLKVTHLYAVGLFYRHEPDRSKVSPHVCLLKFKSRQASLACFCIPVKKEVICFTFSVDRTLGWREYKRHETSPAAVEHHYKQRCPRVRLNATAHLLLEHQQRRSHVWMGETRKAVKVPTVICKLSAKSSLPKNTGHGRDLTTEKTMSQIQRYGDSQEPLHNRYLDISMALVFIVYASRSRPTSQETHGIGP